jgi:hypothetical protein
MSRQVGQAQALSISDVVIQGGTYIVKQHPRISVAYVVGLLVCILGTGLTPSPEQVEEMNRTYELTEMKFGRDLQHATDR